MGRKVLAVLIVVAALTALVAAPAAAAAKDYNGPRCTNIVDGDGSYRWQERDASGNYFSPAQYVYVDDKARVEAFFSVSAPSCKQAEYTLFVLDSSGNAIPDGHFESTGGVIGTDAAGNEISYTYAGDGVTTSYSFRWRFDGPGGGTYSPPTLVNILATTAVGGEVADRGPDAGFFDLPLDPTSSGGKRIS